MDVPTGVGGPLDREIASLVDGGRIPGCAIATITPDGRRTAWFHGRANLDPPRAVTERTVFHLLSGTKVYTMAAIMLLVERGALSLDEPVTTYLPELEPRHPVTIRQLASHDSGIPDTLRAFLSVHPGREPGPSTARALSRYRLDRGKPPGRGASYGNVNFAILGELVSRVSGVPYESFVRESLLTPLGSATTFRYEDGMDAATGYLPRFSIMRPVLRVLLPEVSRWINGPIAEGMVALREYSLDNAAIGGLLGSAESFLPMLSEMLSRDDGVLTAASKGEMLTLQSRGAAGIVSRVGVGLAWKRGELDGVGFWNHEGGGPGFCTESRLYPEAGLGIVILMNRSHTAGLSRLCHRICERLRAHAVP